MGKFTVCALLYGDYPRLAERLLSSLSRVDLLDVRYRIGLNNVSERTNKLVDKFIQDRYALGNSYRVWVYHGVDPYYKYPLMRRMFNEPSIDSDYVMWFDDDSFVKDVTPHTLWLDVERKMKEFDMIGAKYYKHTKGNQRQFIEDQPWYNGKPVRRKIDFITGGWWTIKTDILVRHNWPPENFEHNGGDMMLGELCRQHDYKMGSFQHHLGINTKDGVKCSNMPRRGFSQRAIGELYMRPEAPPASFFDILDGKVDATRQNC